MSKKVKSLELLPGDGDQLLLRNEKGQIAHLPDGLAELETLEIVDGILTDRYNNQIEATQEQLRDLLQ
jgi:hypothetical protein